MNTNVSRDNNSTIEKNQPMLSKHNAVLTEAQKLNNISYEFSEKDKHHMSRVPQL